MQTLWLTYSWKDDIADVTYVAQQLEPLGITIKLDRWTLKAGERLWEQIANHIQSEAECDAWGLYATQHSLGSPACQEELAYALDRALAVRGKVFPIIALFPGSVDATLLPASLRVRLCVSLTDPEWKERIRAATLGEIPAVQAPAVTPFALTVYPPLSSGGQWVVEVRPRAGTWAPFFAGIQIDQRARVDMLLVHGPSGRRPSAASMLMMHEPEESQGFWIETALAEATPTMSYFICCAALPPVLLFGIRGENQPFYVVGLEPPGIYRWIQR